MAIELKNSIVARGVIFNSEGKLLLVCSKNKIWHLPGGMTEECESVQAACNREVFEETGLKTEAGKILTVYQNIFDAREEHSNFLHALTIHFASKIVGNEKLDPNWIDPDNNLIENRAFFSKDELSSLTYKPKSFIDSLFEKDLPQIDFFFKNKTGLSTEEIFTITSTKD